jgi:DNA invertase Pin-like site-specific DNA recombinase
MTDCIPKPAAQYLRMSTEHQQYSFQNQAHQIQQYAGANGFTVTRTYSDSAKSGLRLKNRPGLRELLRDAAQGNTSYSAILVYDVSRWGRFQDTDEAAHYEFLCKSAGIPVHYCAETFPNDGSLPSSIMKALKRAMAGEYSRELGVKVFAGQKRLAELGFKQGGPPGLGLRRMLVSADRKPKQLLGVGERKSIATDRVILVPGPKEETDLVREIFRLFTADGWSLKAISRELNRRKVPSLKNATWTHSVVRTLITHPKYIGSNVFAQTMKRLGSPQITRPRTDWVIVPGAHQGIIDPATFTKAQELLASSTLHKTDGQVLDELRSLLKTEGKLSCSTIDEAPGIPCARTLWRRFGSVRKAFELIGYDWRDTPRHKLDAHNLEELRTILRREGALSARIIDASSRGMFSQRLSRRFGTLARAYELIGYDWKANRKRAMRWSKSTC